MTGEPLIKEIVIAASPEEIFPFLTQRDRLLQWMGLAAEIDARPGGVFQVDPNTVDVIRGEFVEVIPPRRVVFTWGWREPGHPVPAGSTRVEIDLLPHAEGTLLRLSHFGLPGGMRDRHDMGWTHYLRRLATVVDGADPGIDPYASPEVRHAR